MTDNNKLLSTVYEEVYDLIWFKMARYYDRHMVDYRASRSMFDLFDIFKNLGSEVKLDVKDLAKYVYDNKAESTFIKEIRKQKLTDGRLIATVYVCMELAKKYVADDEESKVHELIKALKKELREEMVAREKRQMTVCEFILKLICDKLKI